MILDHFQGEGGLQLLSSDPLATKNITSLNGDLTNPANPSAFTDDLTRDACSHISPFLNPRGECVHLYLVHQSPSAQNKSYRITPTEWDTRQFPPCHSVWCLQEFKKLVGRVQRCHRACHCSANYWRPCTVQKMGLRHSWNPKKNPYLLKTGHSSDNWSICSSLRSLAEAAATVRATREVGEVDRVI